MVNRKQTKSKLSLKDLKNLIEALAQRQNAIFDRLLDFINTQFETFSAKALDEWNRRQDHVTGIEQQGERHSGALHLQAVAVGQLERRIEKLESETKNLWALESSMKRGLDEHTNRLASDAAKFADLNKYVLDVDNLYGKRCDSQMEEINETNARIDVLAGSFKVYKEKQQEKSDVEMVKTVSASFDVAERVIPNLSCPICSRHSGELRHASPLNSSNTTFNDGSRLAYCPECGLVAYEN